MAVPSTPAEPPKSADSVRLSVTGEVQFIAVVRVASRMRRAAPLSQTGGADCTPWWLLPLPSWTSVVSVPSDEPPWRRATTA